MLILLIRNCLLCYDEVITVQPALRLAARCTTHWDYYGFGGIFSLGSLAVQLTH